MTAQFTDACLIDGVEHPLWPSPLEAVIAALGLSPIACDLCSAFHRGYVAKWGLRDQGLYLHAVDHWRGDGVRVGFGTLLEAINLTEPLATLLSAKVLPARSTLA